MNRVRGSLIIYSGNGKGKTTAALGLALRALGHGLRTSILQFVKHAEGGEHRALERFGSHEIEVLRLGTGFVTRRPPPEEAVEAARRGLDVARERLAGGRFDLVILDEIFPACEAGMVTEAEILDLIGCRPPRVHLVMTGRGAPASAIERADLVTEMRCVKHPGEGGIEGQAGIEF